MDHVPGAIPEFQAACRVGEESKTLLLDEGRPLNPHAATAEINQSNRDEARYHAEDDPQPPTPPESARREFPRSHLAASPAPVRAPRARSGVANARGWASARKSRLRPDAFALARRHRPSQAPRYRGWPRESTTRPKI